MSGPTDPAPSIEVRTEHPDDRRVIQDVVARAFGQTEEADLVDALREHPAWIAELSVVGLLDGRLVGHALMTRLPVGVAPALALAPVAVAPEAQGIGIGTAMVRELLRRSAEAGEHLVVVVGEPEYYGRFGFVPAASMGIEGPFEEAGDAFQAMAIGDPAMAPRGRVRYPEPFGIPDS